jgi:hypothetical protein
MPSIRSFPYALLVTMFVTAAAHAADLPAPADTDEVPRPMDASAPQPALEATAVPASVAERRQAPAGTELMFEMVDSLSSKTSQRGDRFSLRLIEPLVLDGQLLIPAGTLAVGEVVHADRARAGGQAGELILAARYLDWDGRQLPLKSFRAGVGRSRTDAAVGVMVAAGVAGFLVRGGQLEIAAGSPITATLREAVELAALPTPAAGPAEMESGEETTVIATPAAPETAAVPATPATAAINDTTSGETSE